MAGNGKKESQNNGVFMKTYPGGWRKKIMKRTFCNILNITSYELKKKIKIMILDMLNILEIHQKFGFY